MSSTIGWEAQFWLYAAALGACLLFLYDCFRIVRRVFPHKTAAVGIEDVVYWLVSGVFIFRMLYRFNNGIIRWFAVFGMLVGMVLYHLTISVPFVKHLSRWLGRFCRWIWRPIRCLFGKMHNKLARIGSKGKKVTNSFKKKLKRKRKEGKIEAVTTDRRESFGKTKSQKRTKTTE